MATIYAFQLSNGSFKVGQTSKDDPYERLEKTFSTGSVLYRYFFVDPARRHAIENLIHKELAPHRDTRADGVEIFLPESKPVIDQLFDLWQEDEQQAIVLGAEGKALLDEYKVVRADELEPAIPLDDELAGWIDLWRYHKNVAARHKKLCEVWQDQISLRIGKSSGVQGELEWKPRSRIDVDSKKLKELYPDIHAECSKVVLSRTMTELKGAR